jgi:hypothetical protein
MAHNFTAPKGSLGMYNEPYDTSVLRNYPVKTLTAKLEENYIQEHLNKVNLPAREDEDAIDALYEVLPGNESIEPMEAPKLIETRQGTKVVIDSRATKRVDRAGETFITAPSDYKFATREAILTYLWATQGSVAFSQLGILPIRVYARWISEGLVRRLGLDPADQLRISVLAAYFYLSSMSQVELSDGQKIGVSNLIGRALGLPVDHVLPVVQAAGYLSNLKEFLTACQTAEGASPRLEAANVGLLYTLLNSSWFGARKSLIVSTALEYPPTFLTMLLTAYTDRSYHASFFAKTAQAANKGSLEKDFILAMNHLSRGFTDV